MVLKLPVCEKELETDGGVDSPNKIVYYLIYKDENYSGKDFKYFSPIKKNIINDNWFVISEEQTPG